MSDIDDVHDKALRLFLWQPDKQTFGQDEYWTSLIKDYTLGHTMKGDCDDFALTCADALLACNFSRSDLGIAVCMTETGENHCVLIVQKEFLVDNRQRRVIPWRDAPYKWNRAMDYNDPKHWFDLSEVT